MRAVKERGLDALALRLGNKRVHLLRAPRDRRARAAPVALARTALVVRALVGLAREPEIAVREKRSKRGVRGRGSRVRDAPARGAAQPPVRRRDLGAPGVRLHAERGEAGRVPSSRGVARSAARGAFLGIARGDALLHERELLRVAQNRERRVAESGRARVRAQQREREAVKRARVDMPRARRPENMRPRETLANLRETHGRAVRYRR